MTPLRLQSALGQAVWLLADTRAYLKTHRGSLPEALCQRIDDYFCETYAWLRTLDQVSLEALSTSAEPAVNPGEELRAEVISPLSFSPAKSTGEPLLKSPARSSNLLSGGTPSTPPSPWADFF